MCLQYLITFLIFSLFIPAVYFQCFRKYCRFQSIHSQIFICIYLLYVTRTTCFGLSYANVIGTHHKHWYDIYR